MLPIESPYTKHEKGRKTMKKITALLVAMMLLCMMLPTALAEDSGSFVSAYEPVTPSASTVKHTMTLTKADLQNLPYGVVYTFAVGNAQVVQPSDIKVPDMAVTGVPVIAPLEYTTADTFVDGACTRTVQIDWSGVTIKEPGVYVWEVTKSMSEENANDDDVPTNQNPTLYLYVYVTDNNGLSIQSYGLTQDATLNTKGDLADQYPVQTLNLSINKTVDGTMASRDQYFKFTVELNGPSADVNTTYEIEGLDAVVPVNAYNPSEITNAKIIEMVGGKGKVDLWLKHGQTATIKDLLSGTSYTVSETVADGYTAESAITGDTTGIQAGGATASDSSLQSSATVAFTNTKEATVPTGVVLNTNAAFMGLLLAAAMLLVVSAGKRKETAE